MRAAHLRLLPTIAAAAVALGCGRETPPAPAPMAAKVVEIAEVNSARGFVDSIALPRDVSYVATSERGGRIRLWTAAGTEEPITLQYRQAVVDLAFSPNGGLLASLGRHGEGALRLWQPQARAGATAWREVAAVPMGSCLSLRFDGSGGRLAVMCEREVLLLDLATRLETAYVWDVATGKELLVDAHAEAAGPPAGSMRFAGDGRLLAPTGDRRGMRLLRLAGLRRS